jgi:hypothetical protein
MKPQVTFLTSKGDLATQERAKNLTKFVRGMFYRSDIYRKHQRMFKDGTIFDLGALKHYRDGNRIISERVFGPELMVDAADAMYGDPQCLYQVKYVHKEIIKRKYKEYSAFVDAAQTAVDYQDRRSNASADYVVVVESWKKASEDGTPGKHIIAISNTELFSEDWTKKYFPFTFYKWSDPTVGWYGQSLADRLTGNQIEINRLLRVIQRSFQLGSTFKVFLEYGSRVAKEQLNNEIGSIVYYSGNAPQYVTPQTVHPEFFSHLRYLIQISYEEAGISQLSATSKLPSGLDGGSGKALREYNDLETERFVLNAQAYEASFLETARQFIDLAREIEEDGGDLEVQAESKKFIDSIKWSDVKMEDNEFIMQMFPTSGLPNTPAGRLKYVEELLQGGFIDRPFARSLLDFPDTEEYTSLADALIDDIRETAYQIVYKGKYMPPEPIQGLEFGLQYFRSMYLRSRREGVAETRLEMMRRWMSSAQLMVDKARSAAQTQVQLQQAATVTGEAAGQAAPRFAALATGPAPGNMPPTPG